MWQYIPNPVKHWKAYGLAILLATNATTFGLWRHTDKVLGEVRIELTDEKAAHAADNKRFSDAQAEADRHANQVRQNLLRESQENARQADARYGSLLAEYRANLLRYQASQSYSGGTGYSQLPAPASSDRPSTSPVVPAAPTGGILGISIEDAQVCAVNTARLQAVQAWAVTLPRE